MFEVLISKEVFGALALFLTFAAFVPYILSILAGETKPHVFSWLIWGFGTVVVFVAQLLDGGGYGAWVIGISGCISFSIAVLAWLKSGDTSIVKMDWVFLILAASALPLWVFTETALSAVIVLTLVDLLGFGPSIRKAYDAPNEESAIFFAVGALRNAFVVLALDNYSWTTVLFPAAVGIACCLFVGLIVTRRRISKGTA
ncbi:MAG: hypothetical protein AAF719_08135 [Pseudomonadota bacterium]